MIAAERKTSRMHVSLVIPVHNEAQGLPLLVDVLQSVTSSIACEWSFLFINDGSSDDSLSILEELKAQEPRIGIINLSRCFGKEYAVSAGLKHSDADAVVLMDADLQDPPQCLVPMVKAWQSGFDVVAMRRVDRQVDSWFKRQCASLFYHMISNMTNEIQIPSQVGDFRLMSRRVVDVINTLPESNRCLKGLFAWVGFSTTIIDYKRDSRSMGQSQWSLLKLIKLAMDGFTAFSIVPLRLATFAGITTAAFSVLFGLFTLFKTVFIGEPVAGYTTLLTIMTFLGGIQLLAIGMLGEYVGRTFLEVKGRPLFVVESIKPPGLQRTRPQLVEQQESCVS